MTPEHLVPIALRHNSPRREPSELADFLVRQGIFHAMQADWALEEWCGVVLSQLLYGGTRQRQHGHRLQVRLLKADAYFALKIVPRRSVVSLNTVVEKVQALREIRHPRVSALFHSAQPANGCIWPGRFSKVARNSRTWCGGRAS